MRRARGLHALGGRRCAGAHFVAITSNDEAARAFGVAGADVLPIWDWVGGRYSLWSPADCRSRFAAAGTRIAELLAGAAASTRHFRETPLERNLPVLLALVDFWNARVLGYPQRIVAPARRGAQAAAELSAAADAGKQRQVGAARRITGRTGRRRRRCGADPAPTASTPSSSGCIRARRWQPSSSSCRCAPPTRSASSKRCWSPMRWRRRRR